MKQPGTTRPPRLTLLGGWSFDAGGIAVPLHARERRLVALLALDGPQPRRHLAGRLWPDATDDRALGSLRASVWQIRHAVPGLLDISDHVLGLARVVEVDLHRFAEAVAAVLLDRAPPSAELLRALQTPDLLPGWYDDWVIAARERQHLQRSEALDLLAASALDDGQPGLAADAAGFAVRAEPLREQSRRLLVRSHLALGNTATAVQIYRDYARLSADELGVAPSREFATLIDGVSRTGRGPHARPRRMQDHGSSGTTDPRRAWDEVNSGS